jgi:hypothetical protein
MHILNAVKFKYLENQKRFVGFFSFNTDKYK